MRKIKQQKGETPSYPNRTIDIPDDIELDDIEFADLLEKDDEFMEDIDA